MAFTGIFHFIWHLPYFGNIFKRQDNQHVIREYQKRTSSEITTNLFITNSSFSGYCNWRKEGELSKCNNKKVYKSKLYTLAAGKCNKCGNTIDGVWN